MRSASWIRRRWPQTNHRWPGNSGYRPIRRLRLGLAAHLAAVRGRMGRYAWRFLNRITLAGTFFMIDIGLKEWATVCELLAEGRLALLIRKGGIHESGGPGVFGLEHPRFLLFPSWLHQKPEMIKESERSRVTVFGAEPSQITFHAVGEAAKIWRLRDRASFDLLDDLHCWTAAQIDMRFSYKPQNPLYLLAVRVSRLAAPRTVANHAEYAGCKSWVPLRPSDSVDDAGASPVLSDGAFGAIVERVDRAIGNA